MPVFMWLIYIMKDSIIRSLFSRHHVTFRQLNEEEEVTYGLAE